jgi:hypothetical protein
VSFDVHLHYASMYETGYRKVFVVTALQLVAIELLTKQNMDSKIVK